MALKIYSAIIFFSNDQRPTKYRRITNQERFINFVKATFPAAIYINFYDKSNGSFVEQIKLV